MSKSSWWRRLFGLKPNLAPFEDSAASEFSLREFVYLDEVSLLSLLSSQTGEITDSTSEQASQSRDTAVDAAVGSTASFIAKAEVTSRYQTSNSSTIQTSRKATVQSQFRELHRVPGLRLIEPVLIEHSVESLSALRNITDLSKVASSDELIRGRLVEFRVRLAADPVFHMGTMVSEFTSMSEDYPEMFAAGEGLSVHREARTRK